MNTTNEATRPAGTILFNTGFEGTTHLSAATGPYFHGHPEQYEDFRGNDPTVPAPNDWAWIAADPVLGTLRIYHEGGDESQRFARVVPDEADPTNRVLRFWIGEPNVAAREPAVLHPKSRVQAELYGNTGLRELYQSVRMRFHPDFALLKQYPHSFSWLTLAEFWNKPFWSEVSADAPMPFPFRISLGVKKLAAGPVNALYFGVESQIMASPPPDFQVAGIWHETNTDFAVPVGSWMTLDTYYREGDRDTGRFFCAVTPDSGPRRVLFDIHDWTYHPQNPAPDGLTHYNPIKLYTSAGIVEFLRHQGAALQVDWDDFALWSGRTPKEEGA
ncbi:MAG: hypothetical protein H7145_17315 [Akkermansiaceae bacterium]|nr:hypothetical protein [Armatimonadota bacterium]